MIFWKIRQFPLRNLRKFENLTDFGLFRKKSKQMNTEIPEKFHQSRDFRQFLEKLVNFWK